MGAFINGAKRLVHCSVHQVNLKKLARCGSDSVLACRIEQHQPGGTIEVGDYSYVRGRLITHFPTSRLTIGDNCFINARTVIESFEQVQIGSDAQIGFDVIISDGQHHSTNWADRVSDQRIWRNGGSVNAETLETKPVIVEDGVWIGARAIILPGITLGEGSTVGAGSVVTKSVPPFSVAAGNPARIVSTVEPRRPG